MSTRLKLDVYVCHSAKSTGKQALLGRSLKVVLYIKKEVHSFIVNFSLKEDTYTHIWRTPISKQTFIKKPLFAKLFFENISYAFMIGYTNMTHNIKFMKDIIKLKKMKNFRSKQNITVRV